mgnify:FL=1
MLIPRLGECGRDFGSLILPGFAQSPQKRPAELLVGHRARIDRPWDLWWRDPEGDATRERHLSQELRGLSFERQAPQNSMAIEQP